MVEGPAESRADEGLTREIVGDGAGGGGEPLLVFTGSHDNGRVLRLADRAELGIGRRADLAISVDDDRVSRSHARIWREGPRLWVEDLGSRNGTRLNGWKLVGGKRELLASDHLAIGPLELVVALAGPPRPAPQSLDDRAVIADPEMSRLYQVARRVALADTTVLIVGETGAGKEVLAERIHRFSKRAEGPFVRLSCAALPESLIESELFGHERGAFTGAEKGKVGYLEAAHGGTLFLDELGEMPLATQAKLLRALETRRISRLGSTRELPIDLRLISATHRDLAEQVKAGRFREDLYYRINAFTLRVPPLRERKAEILLLAELFAREIALRLTGPPPSLSPEVLAALTSHRWPGNVRELKNAMEHAVVLAEHGRVELEHLPDSVRAPRPTEPLSGTLDHQLEGVERARILEALAAEGQNRTHAAKRLGISRRALLYKIQKYGIDEG